MKRSILSYIAFSVGLAFLPWQMSYAQSGVELSKELSKKAASDKLMENDTTPIDINLRNNGIDTSKDPSSPTYAQFPTVDPNKVQGGPLTLLNCGNGGITVKTYNSNDSVLLIPFQSVGIVAAQTKRLKCATSSCKLQIGGLKTGALSGYQVYVGGKIRATNGQAMGTGCAVYK